MLVIGLTGSIGSGKSTVARMLAERGAEVIDCDDLSREVTLPGTPGLAAVRERFGAAVIDSAGRLDRAALAAIVFRHPQALADLETIVHPLVTAKKDALLAASSAAVGVVEAIKLIEAGYHERCDAVWVVTAPVETRIERLVRDRGMSEEAARQRIAAQGDDTGRLAHADRVIINDGDLARLAERVESAWQEAV